MSIVQVETKLTQNRLKSSLGHATHVKNGRRRDKRGLQNFSGAPPPLIKPPNSVPVHQKFATMLRAGGLLDVLTSLSDCRHETVERIMERRISGGSCMCWMDFHNVILCSGFICTLLIYSIIRLPRRGAPRPILTITDYHACVCIPAITP